MAHLALALNILHLELFRVWGAGGLTCGSSASYPRWTEGRALISEPPHLSRPWHLAAACRPLLPSWGRAWGAGLEGGPPASSPRAGVSCWTAGGATVTRHPAGSRPTRASVSQASSSHEPSTPKPSKVMNRRILQINQGIAVESWEDLLVCPTLSFVVTRATGAACTGRCTRGGSLACTRCTRRPGGTGPYRAHLQGGSASLPRENCPGDQEGRPALPQRLCPRERDRSPTMVLGGLGPVPPVSESDEGRAGREVDTGGQP